MLKRTVQKFVTLSVWFALCLSQEPTVVDVGAFFDERSSKLAIKQATLAIDEALQRDGLVVIMGYEGYISSLDGAAFAAAQELFSLSLTEKQNVGIRNDPDSFGRGYLGFGDESGVAANFEPKEGYSYGSVDQSTKPTLLNTPNRWPVGLSQQSELALNAVYSSTVRIAKVIIQALSSQFACSEGAPDLSAVATGGEHISLMRLFHYYHEQSPLVQEHLQRQRNSSDTKRLLGSSPHTDWGFLTVILADQVGGLQFLRRGGSVANEADWMDVPSIPGSLVINGGDYLSLISRGVFHSPVHRVLTPGSSTTNTGNVGTRTGTTAADSQQQYMDRTSFVLFFYPAYESPVSADVLAQCTHRSRDQLGQGETSQRAEVTLGQQGTGEGYNTLLRLEGQQGESPRTFGDYVIRKWEGVYRKA